MPQIIPSHWRSMAKSGTRTPSPDCAIALAAPASSGDPLAASAIAGPNHEHHR
jgi:hypothetical protein